MLGSGRVAVLGRGCCDTVGRSLRVDGSEKSPRTLAGRGTSSRGKKLEKKPGRTSWIVARTHGSVDSAATRRDLVLHTAEPGDRTMADKRAGRVMERITGPHQGFYIASYASETGASAEGYLGYAKICRRRPESYWDANCLVKLCGEGLHADPAQ